MDSRHPGLKKIFDDIISGERQLSDPLVPHFIRSISTHPDPATCLHELTASERGLKAIQTAVSSNLSTESLNGDVAGLLAYLRNSKLEHLGGGDTLQRLLRALVEIPGFWRSLTTAFGTGGLRQSTERSFSWLLLQLVVSPPEISEQYRLAASNRRIIRTLLHSPDTETCSNARKIRLVISLYPNDKAVPPEWFVGPGWRHDNDSRLYQEISILPTPDEINSTERPHLKTVDEIDDLKLTSPTKMFTVHIENQFRLLREDLVHDTHENVQVALGNKKGRHTGVIISDLLLTGIYTDEKSKWGLKFTCSDDLPFFSSLSSKMIRMDRLEKDRNYLRHGSFASLVSENEIIAFVTIVRNAEMLAQNPPVIAVQLEGTATVKGALLRLRRCPRVSLLQLNTPLFAYEPILRSLQAMEPSRFLLDSTLLVKPHRPRATSGNLSDIDQETISDLLCRLPTTTGSQRQITLDNAQMEAFVCGLTQKVALIQGPPGNCFLKFCEDSLNLSARRRNWKILHRSPAR